MRPKQERDHQTEKDAQDIINGGIGFHFIHVSLFPF